MNPKELFKTGEVRNPDVMCHWPGGVPHKAMYSFEIPLPEDEDFEKMQTAARLPFCVYHHAIVMGGKFWATKKDVKKKTKVIENGVEVEKEYDAWEFTLHGPLEQVEIIEQVIAARELAKANK